jgi:hypothetical protein
MSAAEVQYAYNINPDTGRLRDFVQRQAVICEVSLGSATITSMTHQRVLNRRKKFGFCMLPTNVLFQSGF